MTHQQTITANTPGRGLFDITGQVAGVVREAGVDQGLCHVFIQHTSAGLTIQENADPDVHRDLDGWMERTVIDGDAHFRHTAEGPDDMSAHIRTMLTDTSMSIPVVGGRLGLGTWQGLYVYEHRTGPHRRRVVVTVR